MPEFKQLCFDNFLESYKEPKIGIPTGFSSLDRLMFGFNPGRVYTIGGESGTGKTAIFMDFILAAAKSVPVGMISMEMTISELQERMVCRIADINSQKLKSGKVDIDEKNEIQKAIKTIKKLKTIAITEEVNCFYPDWKLANSKPSDSVEALIEDWTSQGCKIIFIDYLQMADLAEKTDRDDLIYKRQSQKLKKLAKKYKIAIVVAAQLNGNPEKRRAEGKDPKPQKGDLFGSRFIWANSDVVMFLYREEAHQKRQEPSIFDRCSEEACVILAKVRGGPANIEVPLSFKGYCTSFEDKEKDTVEDLF